MRIAGIRIVACLLLAVHGLMAVAGNSGLHMVTGCSHEHDVTSECCGCAAASEGEVYGSHGNEHHDAIAIQAKDGLCGEHDCPICQWWLANGRHVVAVALVFSCDLQPLAELSVVCDCLLPSSDLHEHFARGPPAANLFT